ncbi:unnamed protein product, partial [Porites evermanni]
VRTLSLGKTVKMKRQKSQPLLTKFGFKQQRKESAAAALSIFDPNLIPTSATELSSYGVESIRVLASHYCPEQHDRLLAEWNILKYHMKEKTIPADVKEEKTIMPAEWCMGQMMIQRSTFTSLLPSAMHGLRGLLVECS